MRPDSTIAIDEAARPDGAARPWPTSTATLTRGDATCSTAGSTSSVPEAAAAGDHRDATPRRRHLFNRWLDFLGLGGGSLVVMAALAAFFPGDEAARAVLAVTMLFLAHFVNHPHFAHSYQIFYRDFARKAFSPDSALRHRYRFAGVLVPVVLVVFYAVTLGAGNAALLGLAANVMFFTVGWHYARQGYGILMVDAVHTGFRLGAAERRRLLWNTHLTWITYWLLTNDTLAKKDYWGLTWYTFEVPDPVLIAMASAVAVSTLAVGRDLFVRWRAGARLPFNGLVAYVAAVYIWLMIGRMDPVLLLVVPFFHSLQYLCVVWRYQLEVEAEAEARAGARLRARTAGGSRRGWTRAGARLPSRTAGGSRPGSAPSRRDSRDS